MKASELIEKLQEEIKHFGDRDLKGLCDDLEGDGMFDIGEIGWYSDKDRQGYITLICAECAYNHTLDHLRAKYEFDSPDEAYYPDEGDRHYGEERP